MLECMIDLETMGVKPGCLVMTIGVAVFERDGTVHETLEVQPNVVTQLTKGMRVETATQDWWGAQSSEAKFALAHLSNTVDVRTALMEATALISAADVVWAQGANFDFPILEALYDRFEVPVPWKFWVARDTRSVYHEAEVLAGWDREAFDATREGTHHDALDDCRHQIAALTSARDALKVSVMTRELIRDLTEPANGKEGGA